MKTKRAFTFLLALCMAVSLLHVGVLAEDELTEWERLQELLSGTEGTVTLTQSYTAAEGDERLEISEGRTVTLDLNGFAVDGSALSDFTLRVLGTLTLKDSGNDGKLIGSGTGALQVDDAGTCRVESGTITAKNAAHGAVSVGSGAVFIVSGAPEIDSVYLWENAVITVGGELKWETPLPVKTEVTPTDEAHVPITSGLVEHGGTTEQFISVDTSYDVVLNDSGEAVLRPSVTAGTDGRIIVGRNEPVTLGKTYAFIPEDDGAYVFYSVGAVDTVGGLYLNDELIAESDGGGEGHNFRISAFLNAKSRCKLYVRAYNNGDNGGTCTVVVEYRAAQTISFASATQAKTYGDADFTVTATGAKTSVSYQVTDGDAATVDSATGAVHIVKAGTAAITATAEETSAYASATASCTLTVDPKSVAIPTAASGLKWTGSEQTGVASGEGYSVTNGAATAVGSYTATATLDNTANYKWSDNTTAAKSIAWSIGKANSPAAPTGLSGVAPTTDGGSNGKITGVTTNMEYSGDSAFGTKTPCSGTEITGLTAGAYYVRYKETATHEAGATATVQVPAYTPPTVYSVTVTNDGHGTGSASPASGTTGTAVTLTASPASGYRFKEWQVVSGGVTVTNNKFTIGTANVTVKAVFEKITYSVSGSFDSSGKLVATVTAPKDSVLIAVSYASSGKMTDTKTYEVTAAVNNGTHTFDTLAMASGNTCKIMLVDKTTHAPLSAAWGS